MTDNHEHYWHYVRTVYEGRYEGDASVVRYCRCGARQRAYTERWYPLPKDHDANSEIDAGNLP